MIDTKKLFNGEGNGREKPNYQAIVIELIRLREINNSFFSTFVQKEQALNDTGRIAAGLFNRAALLDKENPDRKIEQ